MSTFGPAYDRNLDEPALADQRNRIREFMLNAGHAGYWVTLAEIHEHTGYPEASISAQLRHLRKERFGGYEVQKRRRAEQRVWEYRLEPPRAKDAPDQMLLIPETKKPMEGH